MKARKSRHFFAKGKKTDHVVKADKAKFLVTFAALILQRWRSIAELPPAKLWLEYILTSRLQKICFRSGS